MQFEQQPPLPVELPAVVAAPAGAPPPGAHEHRVGSAWRLYSREELDQMDMSRLDGIDPELQRQLKWAAIRMMIHAQITLNMDVTALFVACVFLHRYFARRSMAPHRNNVLVVAMACLYLGGKVQDSPKSVRDIMYACLERRYQGQPELVRAFRNNEWYQRARERVFLAERALLYELDFGLNVDMPFGHLMILLSKPDDEPVEEGQPDPSKPLPVLQLAWEAGQHLMSQVQDQSILPNLAMSIANEAYKGTLCLQYSGLQLAMACLWLAAKLLQLSTPPPLEGWWACDGLLDQRQLLDIVSQLLADYSPSATEVVADDTTFVLAGANLVDEHQLMEVDQQQHAGAAAAAAVNQEEAAAGAGAAAAGAAQEPAQQGNGTAAAAAAAVVDGLDEYDELFSS